MTALLAYLLWPSENPESNVELVAADQRQGAAAPAPAPPPMQVPTVAVPQVAATPPAGAIPEGLTLTGVAGSGAIFAFADGTQRYVARGREVAPGIRLEGVSLRHVVIASGSSAYRLGFGGSATPIQAVAPAAPAGGTGPQLVVPGSGRNALGGPLITQAQQQVLSRQFLMGLEPRRAGAQVTGWVVKPDANIASLAQAGLQPGDVLLTVNGERVTDQEQVAELSQQIANSRRVEFGFERGGRRMTRAIEVNPGR